MCVSCRRRYDLKTLAGLKAFAEDFCLAVRKTVCFILINTFKDTFYNSNR